jgi:hypothetical protein
MGSMMVLTRDFVQALPCVSHLDAFELLLPVLQAHAGVLCTQIQRHVLRLLLPWTLHADPCTVASEIMYDVVCVSLSAWMHTTITGWDQPKEMPRYITAC